MDSKQEIAKYRLDRLLSLVEKLGIEFPVADIAKKTGYAEPTVSQYLSGKLKVSSNFLKSFCDTYNLDYQSNFLPATQNHAVGELPREKLYAATREGIERTMVSEPSDDDIKLAKKMRGFLELIQQVDDHEKRLKIIEKHLKLN